MNTQDQQLQDQLIGALIGLVRVCNHKQRTPASDTLIQKGLTLLSAPSPDDNVLRRMIDQTHEEKHMISPGCSVCQSPCGGTFDYDLTDLHQEPDANVQSMKTLLLLSARDLASRLQNNGLSEAASEEIRIFLYRALMAVGDNYELEDLLQLLMEVGPLVHSSLLP